MVTETKLDQVLIESNYIVNGQCPTKPFHSVSSSTTDTSLQLILKGRERVAMKAATDHVRNHLQGFIFPHTVDEAIVQ